MANENGEIIEISNIDENGENQYINNNVISVNGVNKSMQYQYQWRRNGYAKSWLASASSAAAIRLAWLAAANHITWLASML